MTQNSTSKIAHIIINLSCNPIYTQTHGNGASGHANVKKYCLLQVLKIGGKVFLSLGLFYIRYPCGDYRKDGDKLNEYSLCAVAAAA